MAFMSSLKLPLAPDDQLAQLKVEQVRRTYFGSLVLPDKLPDSMLSLPNAVAPQLLEPCNDVANFGKISFFFVWSWLIRQGL